MVGIGAISDNWAEDRNERHLSGTHDDRLCRQDGHTASLFPGQPALEEYRRWALAIVGARPETRITLTYPVLNSSRDVAFLAKGEGKREVVARARAGDRTLPAARVHPVGRLHWFVDRAAAA